MWYRSWGWVNEASDKVFVLTIVWLIVSVYLYTKLTDWGIPRNDVLRGWLVAWGVGITLVWLSEALGLLD